MLQSVDDYALQSVDDHALPVPAESCNGESQIIADAAAQLGVDCWARFVSFIPLVAWPSFVSLNRTIKEAVLRTAKGEPYQGSNISCFLNEDRLSAFIGLSYTHVRAAHLRIGSLDDYDAGAAALDEKVFLPKTLEALKLTGSGKVWHDVFMGKWQWHRLKLLDIVGLSSHRGRVLQVCIHAGVLSGLQELRAGAPSEELWSANDSSDTVIDQLPDLAVRVPSLEAIDIGYSRSESGLGYPVCTAFLQNCHSLLHLDFSMVMTWRCFDPVLELIIECLPALQSLAIHGLQISSEIFVNFCAACQGLTNLQMRGCDIQHSVLTALFDLPSIRRLDLGGTFLLLSQADVCSQQLGIWLQRQKHLLLELTLACVVSVEEVGQEETIASNTKAWLDAQYPEGTVYVTALSEDNQQGTPLTLNELRRGPGSCELQGWLTPARFFERVRPTLKEAMPNVDAGDLHGQWFSSNRQTRKASAERRASGSRSSARVPWEREAARRCQQQ